jgi:hypothetical protein
MCKNVTVKRTANNPTVENWPVPMVNSAALATCPVLLNRRKNRHKTRAWTVVLNRGVKGERRSAWITAAAREQYPSPAHSSVKAFVGKVCQLVASTDEFCGGFRHLMTLLTRQFNRRLNISSPITEKTDTLWGCTAFIGTCRLIDQFNWPLQVAAWTWLFTEQFLCDVEWHLSDFDVNN